MTDDQKIAAVELALAGVKIEEIRAMASNFFMGQAHPEATGKRAGFRHST